MRGQLAGTSRQGGWTPIILVASRLPDDTPLHAAYQHNYYDDMRNVMRGLLGQCLKDNADPSQPQTFLHKAVLTGIVRVAKEDIFSDLNNLGVYGVTDNPFARWFGFTEEETNQLLRQRDLARRIDAVRKSYNGYRVGRDKPVTLYNPWSVISYLIDPAETPRLALGQH
ncbi:MAG: AAA family ATPase [Myxococcota bacterium]